MRRVAVPAGSVIVGAELATNDLRTTFPKVTLYRGRVQRLTEAAVVREFSNVRATTLHHVTLACAPILVSAAEDFYVAVTWPPSDGVLELRHGAGIPASSRTGGGESYVASGPNKDLQRIEGVELALKVIVQQAPTKSEGAEKNEPRDWRTFFEKEGVGGDLGTTFRFGVQHTATVTLTIYDVSGREVRALVRQTVEPGEYSASWDGRIESGASVAAGVYIARFVAGDQSFRQKVVIAR